MRKGLAVVTVLTLMVAFSLPVLANSQHENQGPPKYDTTTTTAKHNTTTTKHSTSTTKHEETTTTKRDNSTTTKPTTTTTKPTTTTTKPTTTTTKPTTTTTTEPTTSTTEPPVVTPFCVDVNTAPQAELEQLNGVNAVLALAIIAGRPYETVEDLAEVITPEVLVLILVANAQTGAFASDDCLTPTLPEPFPICHLEDGQFTIIEVQEPFIQEHIDHGDIFPIPAEGCPILPTTTTTTTTQPPPSTTEPTTTTTTTEPTTTTVPFAFGAAATVCVAEVPTIRIEFQNTFPELAGLTGTLTMADVNGNVVSTQALVYEPNTTVDLLYPGTAVNPDGSIDDVPGWILTDGGLWVRDPSDEFLREGISMTYTVNPTATAFVTYPPESSACANPENPPGATSLVPRTPSPEDGILPFTGADTMPLAFLAGALGLLGLVLLASTRKGRIDSD